MYSSLAMRLTSSDRHCIVHYARRDHGNAMQAPHIAIVLNADRLMRPNYGRSANIFFPQDSASVAARNGDPRLDRRRRKRQSQSSEADALFLSTPRCFRYLRRTREAEPACSSITRARCRPAARPATPEFIFHDTFHLAVGQSRDVLVTTTG